MREPLRFQISPSSLTFEYDGCKRCFQLHARLGIRQIAIFPGVCSTLDNDQRKALEGQPTSLLGADLLAGTLRCKALRLKSTPIAIPGTRVELVIAGSIDCHVELAGNKHGIIDFKTIEPTDPRIAHYARQLHAYALAAENPAPGVSGFDPVVLLGLMCFAPRGMTVRKADYWERFEPSWIGVDRNDASFVRFLKEVADVLESPELADPNPKCEFCRRDSDVVALSRAKPAARPLKTTVLAAFHADLRRQRGWT